MTNSIPVILTDEEIQHALDFIDRMREDKKAYNVIDRKFDKNNSSYAVNLMGYLGELATAKVLKVPTDDKVRTGGDDGYDLKHSGKTIQVKTSTTRDLIFNSLSLFKADIAILVELEGDKTQPHIDAIYHIHGFISKDKFMNNYRVKNYGYGDRYVVSKDILTPITELVYNGSM